VLKLVDGEIKRVDEPALTAINMRLRDDYTADCQRGLDRWNKIIERPACRTARAAACRLPPPDRRVQGRAGDPGGTIVDDATWSEEKDQWLPSKDDGDFIQSLMKPVTEPGQFASWIAPPRSASTTSPATSNT
jgi:benzoyl-CoA 2,3-dioxygenase component B